MIDVKGTLYGTTLAGGVYYYSYYSDSGTVFSITTSGSEKVLHSFGYETDGVQPAAPLIRVGGTLYGTTRLGGAYRSSYSPGHGTVFSITTSGLENVVYSFAGATDGSLPVAGLVNVGGTLYGTTYYGGAYSGCSGGIGCGTVFSITPSGSEKVLHSFGYGTDGNLPRAGLIDVDGTLYGTTSAGGAANVGTIFGMTTSGTETQLYAFKGGTDGSTPRAGLVNVNGTLYGTTGLGGAKKVGTVFSITP